MKAIFPFADVFKKNGKATQTRVCFSLFKFPPSLFHVRSSSSHNLTVPLSHSGCCWKKQSGGTGEQRLSRARESARPKPDMCQRGPPPDRSAKSGWKRTEGPSQGWYLREDPATQTAAPQDLRTRPGDSLRTTPARTSGSSAPLRTTPPPRCCPRGPTKAQIFCCRSPPVGSKRSRVKECDTPLGCLHSSSSPRN